MHIEQAQAAQFGFAVTERLADRLVGRDQFPVRAADEDQVGRVFEKVPEIPQILQRRPLLQAPRGDVGVGTGIAHQGPIGSPLGLAGGGQPEQATILGLRGGDPFHDRSPPPEGGQADGPEFLPAGARMQVVKMHPAHHFVRPVAQHAFDERADVGVQTVGVHLPHKGAGLLREPDEARLTRLQLQLQLLALGDVLFDRHIMRDAPVRFPERGNRHRLPIILAVLFPVLELPVPTRPRREGLPQFPIDRPGRVARLEDPGILSPHLLVRIAGLAGELGIHVDRRPAQIGDDNGGVRLFDHQVGAEEAPLQFLD